jgi:subtilisin family serine protease
MADEFYYNAKGERVPLRQSSRSVAVAFATPRPDKNVEALIRDDERLRAFVAGEALTDRNLVLYRRNEAAPGAVEDFVERVRASDQVRFATHVFYRGENPVLVTDEFVAAFKPEVTRAAIDALNAAHGVTIVSPLPVAANTFLLRVTAPGPSGALDRTRAYFESGLVRYAEPNFIKVQARRFTPNDPFLPQQWHLPRVQAEAAWDITRGDRGVVIAIIDDGVDLDHEDIASPGKIVAPLDVRGGDADPRPQAGDDHGTCVAGVAIANANNTLGVSGMAPDCALMPIRLIGGPQSDADEARSFTHAVDNGAAIISNSWGPTDNGGPVALPGVVGDAFDHALANGRGGLGTVILFASGNGNESVSSPATLDGYASDDRVIAVAAVNDQNVRSGYSDFGPEIDVCAPSDGTSAMPIFWIGGFGMPPDGSTLAITTIDRTGAVGFNPPPAGSDPEPLAANTSYTGTFGGTSSACPLAAGVLGLMISIAPDLRRDQLKFILEATSDKVDFANTDPVGQYQPDGHSQFYGFGRVNALDAVRCSRSLVDRRDFVQSVTVTLRRTTGDRFVATKVIQTIDARRRQDETAADVFLRGGPDGFLRAEMPGAFDEVEVDA